MQRSVNLDAGRATVGYDERAFLQHVHQVQDQRDVQCPADTNLERRPAVGQSEASPGSQRVAAIHPFGHLLDDGRFALD
jgi:hypothetical protein